MRYQITLIDKVQGPSFLVIESFLDTIGVAMNSKDPASGDCHQISIKEPIHQYVSL